MLTKYLTFAVLGVAAQAATRPATFNSPRTFFASEDAATVITGDFNGDGIPDIAAGGAPYTKAGEVSILLGKGDGAFGLPVNTVMNAGYIQANGMAAGDFNGDGKLDLAVAVYSGNPLSGNTVTILFGNGDGTFQRPVSYGVSAEITSIAVADFNGDGKPDIAVAIPDSASVDVLLNQGDGSMATPVHFTVGSEPGALVAGDFNGDGKVDLAVTCLLLNGPQGASAAILLGDGEGGFSAPAFLSLGNPNSFPNLIVLGDFNGDGKPDLAVNTIVYSGTTASSVVSIFLNRAGGSFAPVKKYPIADYIISMAVADFNGDGVSDLAAGAEKTSNKYWLLLSQVGGGFTQPPPSYPGGLLVSNDFNADGKPDLMVNNGHRFTLLPGRGNGTFPATVQYPAGTNTENVTVTDLNGDGIPDLLVNDNVTPSGSISVLIGLGHGSFAPAVSYAAGNSPISLAVGDFNGDGKLDVAVADAGALGSGNAISILLGNGDGTLQPAKMLPIAWLPGTILAADFNGDGKLDLAVTGAQGLWIMMGNGNATFQAPMYYPHDDLVAIVTGDFNGDGKPDIAGITGQDVAILLNNGNGTFPSTPTKYHPGNTPLSIAVGDVDLDGKLDLVVPLDEMANSVAVYLGTGDGTFQAPKASPFHSGSGIYAFSQTRGAVIADFNGDGVPDIAMMEPLGAAVMLGRGDGTFEGQSNFAAAEEPDSIALGDFNGDGKPDLALANYFSHNVSVLVNTTP